MEAHLAPGVHTITFRARSMHSNAVDICRTVITIKGLYFCAINFLVLFSYFFFFVESRPPEVLYCPEAIEIQLQPNEKTREVVWKEPIFKSSSHIKEMFKSKIPGDQFTPGKHLIKYVAIDDDNLSSKCEFYISIIGK